MWFFILALVVIVIVIVIVVVVSYNNTATTTPEFLSSLKRIFKPVKTNSPDNVTNNNNINTNASIFLQQSSKLVASDNTNAQQGYVSMTRNGLILVVGGPGFLIDEGTVWIFSRSAVTDPFVQAGSNIPATGAIGPAERGFSVSVSDDGLVLAVGGPGDNNDTGAVWIYTRSIVNEPFVQQGSKLTDRSAIGARQGYSVSLSADGLNLAVGGPNDNNNEGAVWMYTRSANSNPFVQQGRKLTDGSVLATQGWSVSLSADGLSLAVGGPNDENSEGAVWIYTRPIVTNSFSQQGKKLTDGSALASQGSSVSLSADGLSLAVGGFLDAVFIGTVWVYSRHAITDTFVQQGTKLTGHGNVGASNQGYSVSLSGNGLTLVVGGPNDNNNEGAVWIYTRSAKTENFTQQGSKLIGEGASTSIINQGNSVSLSGDGSSLAVGGPGDNSGTGAVWTFSM